MKLRFALDSWAILAYLQAEEPAGSRVRDLLASASDSGTRLYASAINVGEVYYALWRRNGPVAAGEALSRVRELPVTIVPASWDHVMAAARYKATNRISYADGFVASLAEDLGATVLTGDAELITALSGRLRVEALRRRGP